MFLFVGRKAYFDCNMRMCSCSKQPLCTLQIVDIDKTTLTHWDRVTHTYASKLTIIGSDNGLSPGRRQAIIAIIWTNAGILSIWHWGTNFSDILITIHIFSVKKTHWKMSSGKWRSFVSASMRWFTESHKCAVDTLLWNNCSRDAG